MFLTEKLSFTFPINGITAVDKVSLNFEAGRIHALLGENGAGKSTFARLCTGHLAADNGQITHNGVHLTLRSAYNGIKAGCVLAPQHPQFSAELTVWENLVLGQTSLSILSRFLHPKKTPEALAVELEQYGLVLPLFQKAGTLDAAQLHWTAIGAALLQNPSVFFLDEPTAAFSPQEIVQLYTILRRCANNGMHIIVVTHRIQEVLTFMDSVHILQSGKVVKSMPVNRCTTAEELLEAIFGYSTQANRRIIDFQHISYSVSATNAVDRKAETYIANSHKNESNGLSLSHIDVSDGKGLRFSDFSLYAACGTITGVVGIKNQGIELLEDLLIHAVQPERGSLQFKNIPLTRMNRGAAAYIPSKRMRRGIAHRHSIADNLYARARFMLYPYGIYSKKTIRNWQKQCLFDIPRSWDEPILSLSGGMLQKLIFSRELDNPRPQLVICAEPYWGLDRKVQITLLQQLRSLAEEGSAVLILTSDADAALETCDCIHILYRGNISGFMERSEYNRSVLIAAMMQTDNHD